MTDKKKMEDFFNLPSSEIIEAETLPTKTKEELMIEAREIYTALSTAEKIDFSLKFKESLLLTSEFNFK